MIRDHFRVLTVDLSTGKRTIHDIDGRNTAAGGSGLAAMLFEKYGNSRQALERARPAAHFHYRPADRYFPLMSKTVCAFKSPYHDQYAESHAGGRSALSMRFADFDANSDYRQGKVSVSPHCGVSPDRDQRRALFMGHRPVYRWKDPAAHATRFRPPDDPEDRTCRGAAVAHGLHQCRQLSPLRKTRRRSCHGLKNLKAIMIHGDGSFMLPEGNDYVKMFDKVYADMTDTEMMSKYHNLGTPGNVRVMNDLKALPIRNLQATADPATEGITGERFRRGRAPEECGLRRLPGGLHPYRLCKGALPGREPLHLPPDLL